MGAEHGVQRGPVLAQEVPKVVVVRQLPDNGVLDFEGGRAGQAERQATRVGHVATPALAKAQLLRKGDVHPAERDVRQARFLHTPLCTQQLCSG